MGLKKTNKKEYEGIIAFLQLPLDLQGKLWPLLTSRSKLIISILECLCNGPKTYEEIAELLDISTRTVRQYCYAYLKPFPITKDYRIQVGKNEKRSYCHRTLYVDLKLINGYAFKN